MEPVHETPVTTARTALVTGATGGLGGPLVNLLAHRGWHVFAADVDPPPASPGITPVLLDVTDQTSTDEALATVSGHTDGLDAIVNFAGVLGVGASIEVDEQTLRRILEVNVLGTYRVNKTFFELVLQRRGRIVNMSSETGHQAGGPFNGPYAMSKHAVEAYSDSLRRELQLLGVPVIKIQPGPFDTGMVAAIEAQFAAMAESSRYFGDTIRRLLPMVAQEQRKAADPRLLAQVVYGALVSATPKPAYSVRPDPRRQFLELLPTRWADRLLRRVLQGP